MLCTHKSILLVDNCKSFNLVALKMAILMLKAYFTV